MRVDENIMLDIRSVKTSLWIKQHSKEITSS